MTVSAVGLIFSAATSAESTARGNPAASADNVRRWRFSENPGETNLQSFAWLASQ